jgi:2-oxoglutarate dehydrogenase E2 component (dihydrolipoamide succinyltransferase)
MAVEVRIPELGESVTEGVIARWLKQDGELVRADESVLELETDKATLEIPATASGRLEIVERKGATVRVGTVVARIAQGADRPAASAKPKAASARGKPPAAPSASAPETATGRRPPVEPDAGNEEPQHHDDQGRELERAPRDGEAPPQDAEAAKAKDDVERQVAEMAADRVESPPEEPETPAEEEQPRAPTRGPRKVPPSVTEETDGIERKPMSRLRRRIAERLVEVQRTAAILTTFNEIDLSRLLAARERLRSRFRERHGVDLGLVSLFGRACLLALAEIPILNARIDGDDVVYHRHVNLGIAVSTPRGLVVPVVRDANRLRFAELQRAVEDLARLARDGKLTPDQLANGTFTITNGGVFGSLLSTPILNPPQSGILGMHKIEERPVAVDGQVVIRPMMYVALSYDHRLVDGEQAVTFLVRVKKRLEDPVRMLFEA